MKQFMSFISAFSLGLVFLIPMVLLAEAANGQITPNSVVDCNQVQCTTDGAELPPPPKCIEEIEKTGICIGDAWTLSD
jgi:hypothetical protein